MRSEICEASVAAGSLRYALTGACIGALVGLVFAVGDSFGAFVAGQMPLVAPELKLLLTWSVAVLVPGLALAGAGCGLALWLAYRVWKPAHRLAVWLLPVAWTLAIFAYGAVWRVSAAEALGYVFAIKLAVLALVAGPLSYAGLWLLARGLARRRVRFPAPAMGVALAGLWVAALIGVLAPEPSDTLPTDIAASTAEHPNVLLVVLDTVRADHLSCYGYHRQTTANIDRFAEDARVYTNVLSPGCWTLPSHASFFTGLPNSAHGCNWSHPYLGEEFDTLAEQLRGAGYQTAGLSANTIVSPGRSFDQGFDCFWNPSRSVRDYAFVMRLAARLGLDRPTPTAPDLHRRLARWFRQDYDATKPFFVFLNYIEPHDPYLPQSHLLEWASEGTLQKWLRRNQNEAMAEYIWTGQDTLSAQEIAELETLYDEEIAFTDRKVGELLAFLQDTGLYDDMLIIITSDHGEHFGEHHWMGHDSSLYEPLVRVPLIVRYPGALEAGRDDALVQSHDLYPTILEVAGLPWERRPEHNCYSLLAARPSAGRVGVAEYLAPAAGTIARVRRELPVRDFSRFLRSLRALQEGQMKIIRPSVGESELYDLAKDPMETRDLRTERPDVLTALGAALDGWMDSFQHYEPPPEALAKARETSRKDLDAMRGLGYIR